MERAGSDPRFLTFNQRQFLWKRLQAKEGRKRFHLLTHRPGVTARGASGGKKL